jgi:hypothetical protein
MIDIGELKEPATILSSGTFTSCAKGLENSKVMSQMFKNELFP